MGGESHDCYDLWNSSHAARGPSERIPYATNKVYSTEMYSEEAKKLIDAHGERLQRGDPTPFFLYLAYQNCHAPYEVPERFLQRYQLDPKGSRACFNAMLSAMDDSVAVVVAALKVARMFERTVLIFSGDNGGPQFMGSNTPLRGAKFTTMEGGVRVPAFFFSPLLPPSAQGGVCNALMHSVDWFVTLSTMAGVEPASIATSGPVPPDGIDVLPFILAATPEGHDTDQHNRTSLDLILSPFPKHLLWHA